MALGIVCVKIKKGGWSDGAFVVGAAEGWSSWRRASSLPCSEAA